MSRAVVAVLVLVSSFAFAESEWEKKSNAFRQQVEAKRKKLGLKNDPNATTPEINFMKEGTVVVCPGQSVDVKLKTNLPEGSLFIATLDDIAISKEKLEKGVWSATLTAKASAPPRTFDIRGVHGTSLREAVSVGTFLLGCKHTLVAETDGAKLTAKLDFTSGERTIETSGEWKGGKKQGTCTYSATVSSEGLSLTRQYTQEELTAQMERSSKLMDSPEQKAAQAKLEAAMKKLEPCGKLAPEKMMTCMQAGQKDVESATAAMQKVAADMDRAGAPSFGCNELGLRYEGSALAGEATGCPARTREESVPAKAVITSP